jgi:predicted NUDIX family NTP pyrophosphohydrolase
MPKLPSAGVLLHRHRDGGRREVLLGHMGGPYWARKDEGAWSIPKGEYTDDEEPLAAARREFAEELGAPVPADVRYEPLGSVRQRGGKVVTVWAAEADFDPSAIASNTFEMEWPPGSGQRQSFPEIDRAAWFEIPVARLKIVPGQVEFLDRLFTVTG